MPRLILSTRTTPMNSAWWARSARLIVVTFAAKEDWAPPRIAISTTTVASAVRTMHFISGNKTHCWTMRPGNRGARDHSSSAGSVPPAVSAGAAIRRASTIRSELRWVGTQRAGRADNRPCGASPSPLNGTEFYTAMPPVIKGSAALLPAKLIDHVQHHQCGHPVIGESLPRLGRCQVVESLRLSEDAACGRTRDVNRRCHAAASCCCARIQWCARA